jgi:hydroxypyruvate reductase
MDDRSLLRKAFLAGIDSVEPEASTAAAAERLELGGAGRLMVVAAGKGSLAMVRGIARVAHIDGGVAVAPQSGDCPIPVVIGGHPVPNHGSVEGASTALDIASSATREDTVVCLISGGASALLAAPAADLTLADLQVTNRALLECGADIAESNAVRKHLSTIKGGRLAAAAADSRLVTFVLSDVVGDPLHVIASGPTVPDPTTYGDALDVVVRYQLEDHLPDRVLAHLARGARGEVRETPKVPHPRHDIEIIGSGSDAAEAAAAYIRSQGVNARVVTTSLSGEARRVAVEAVSTLSGRGWVHIYAGETTVRVVGEGRGGRNQEAALAAALDIDGRDVTFLAGGTDGIDGPTDAAGGIVDGGTVERGRVLGLDAVAFLEDNDAYTYLSAVGDLLVTGPTGTNVADLWLVRRG